jgi:hypothetical protein
MAIVAEELLSLLLRQGQTLKIPNRMVNLRNQANTRFDYLYSTPESEAARK